jgi:hypothetical protein
VSPALDRNVVNCIEEDAELPADDISLIVYYASSVYTLMGMSPLLSRILSGVGGLVFFGGA